MNLKYYLRGLGLGLIVTALILGIHNYRHKDSTLSDAQIKERAAALGMVDGSTRLIEEIPSTEEMLAEIDNNENNVTDVISDSEPAESTDEVTEAPGQDAVTEPEESADDVIADASALLEDTTAEISTDVYDDPVLDYPTEGDSAAVITDVTEEPEIEAPAAADSGAGTITISSGDSSDRVARKLADAGIVSSAAEYDRFLCSHGYDRVLRTGTYTISAGMSDDEIARMITGR